MSKKKMNILEAIKYPIGTKFKIKDNLNIIIVVNCDESLDGNIPTKKMIWENGDTVFATDYELGLSFYLI